MIVDLFASLDDDRRRSVRGTKPLPVIARLVAIARSSGRSIVYVHEASAPSIEVSIAERSTSDARLLRAMIPRPADPVLRRGRASAFDASGLDEVLRRRGITRILVVGQVAEDAIVRTALDGVERGLGVAVAPAALVSLDAADGMAALRMMRRNGVDIRLKAYSAFKLGTPGVAAPGSAGNAPGRPELLAAFASVMRREGFSGIRVADVAREAKVSLRTFYEMFPGGKDECLVALFMQQAEWLERAVVRAARSEGDGGSPIERGIAAAVRGLREHQSLAKALLFGLPSLGAEGERVRERATQRFVELLHAGSVAGAPIGAIEARALVGATLELGLDGTGDAGVASSEAIAAALMAMCGRAGPPEGGTDLGSARPR
ncbi:MAG: cysteine hydrolase [Patulibacter minatonensis]